MMTTASSSQQPAFLNEHKTDAAHGPLSCSLQNGCIFVCFKSTIIRIANNNETKRCNMPNTSLHATSIFTWLKRVFGISYTYTPEWTLMEPVVCGRP